MKKFIFICIALICLFIFFWISGGLPKDVKKEAGRKTEQIASARDVVAKQKAKHVKFKTTDEFAFFAVYAQRENWDARFDEAKKMLNDAEKNVTHGKVAAFLKENKKAKAGALWIEIKKVDRLIRKALQASKAPTLRMAELKRIQKECPQLVEKAALELGEIDLLIDKLEKEFTPKAKKEFPKRSDDISKRFTPLKKMQQNSANALIGAQRELKQHTSEGNADYALLSSSTEFIKIYLGKLTKKDKEYRAEINELFQSGTKILVDMRMDYYVTAGRVSWNESSDYPSEHNYIYPPSKTDYKTNAFFTKLKPDVMPVE